MLPKQGTAKKTDLLSLKNLRFGEIETASWLSDDILIIFARFDVEITGILESCLIVDDKTIPLEVRYIPCSNLDLSNEKPQTAVIITARLLKSPESNSDGKLIMRNGDFITSFNPSNIFTVTTDLQSFLKKTFVSLKPLNRTLVQKFLASTFLGHTGTINRIRLGESLFVIREGLHQPLPTIKILQENERNIWIEKMISVSSTLFYLRGWRRDPDSRITQLNAVSPEGEKVELINDSFYFNRPDLEDHFKAPILSTKNGFLNLFETKSPSYSSRGWLCEMKNFQGHFVEVNAPSLIRQPDLAIKMILEDAAVDQHNEDELMIQHIYPAISVLQQQRLEQVEIHSVKQFGKLHQSPSVSIIIPLYKRIDFVEHQLAQFVHDFEMSDIDLIYVLDSPELADSLTKTSGQLFELYNIPFRLVILKQNYGYSVANNVGASISLGRLLLLLNSDVIPRHNGWIRKLESFYDSMPGIGALGPKLLFEDETIQHAGMYFEQHQDSTLWINEHYFKGYHSKFAAANKTRDVPAVTGACLMVSKRLFQEVGGLDCNYVQGDFEDSDFCLRLYERGYKNWYFPQVELFHLEAQSYHSTLRQTVWRYNAWLQTFKWSNLICEAMSQYQLHSPQINAFKNENIQFSVETNLALNLVNQNGSKRANLLPKKSRSIKIKKETDQVDLIELHLQTLSKSSRFDSEANRLWIENDTGAVLNYFE